MRATAEDVVAWGRRGRKDPSDRPSGLSGAARPCDPAQKWACLKHLIHVPCSLPLSYYTSKVGVSEAFDSNCA
jgi:hypothetical protein